MRLPAISCVVIALVVFVSIAHVSAAGRVTVTIGNGRVSIEAHAATLREILDTWAQAGQTVVVNADKIQTDVPLDLSLIDVTEEQALAVLLRPLSGYATTRRLEPATNISRFDRIVLLPTSVASHDSAIINAPAPGAVRSAPVAVRPAPVRPPTPQTVIVNGVARLIGPNGAVIEDDQQGAPPRPAPRPFPAGDAPGPPPPRPNAAPPATTAAPAVVGSSAPGVVINPPQRPNTQPVQR